jgi:hypothetical protein
MAEFDDGLSPTFEKKKFQIEERVIVVPHDGYISIFKHYKRGSNSGFDNMSISNESAISLRGQLNKINFKLGGN